MSLGPSDGVRVFVVATTLLFAAWTDQTASTDRRAIETRKAEELQALGDARNDEGEYRAAIEYYQQALRLWRSAKQQAGEAKALASLGWAQAELGQHVKGLESYRRALALHRKLGQRADEAETLNNIGVVHQNLGEFQNASTSFQAALSITRDIGDRRGEAYVLNNLGPILRAVGRYAEALGHYEQAATIFRDTADRANEAVSTTNLARVYDDLGQYDIARAHYEYALQLARDSGDLASQASLITNLGGIEDSLGGYSVALSLYEEALELHRRVGNRSGEASTLNNIALARHKLGEQDRATSHYQQALEIWRQTGNRANQAITLNNIGGLYHGRAELERATGYFEQALALHRQVGSRAGEAATLANLMRTWKARNRPTVAILFGKQAINQYQILRARIEQVDRDTQRAYVESKANTYRELADLLLAAGRLPEAQHVLRLLKEEEYVEFVRSSASIEGRRTEYTKAEETAIRRFGNLTDRLTRLGTERNALLDKSVLTEAEKERLADIETAMRVANADYQHYVDELDRLGSHGERHRVSQLREAQGLMQTLRELGPGTVALFTLVGNDRLHVVLITSEVQQAFDTAISRESLNRLVLTLREALQNPLRDARPAAQALYQVLMAPLEQALEGAEARTLMWSLDGALRYVPIAALHDGERYVAEKYHTAIFTPASQSRLKDPVTPTWRALGLGVSKPHGPFPALPAVPDELRAIIHEGSSAESGVLPGVIRLDEGFTLEGMTSALRGRFPVVHIASHFQFRPGRDADSFLLLGDGQQLTVSTMSTLPQIFSGVELLTLSACDTATGGVSADGRELEGFGVTAQRQGAKAVLATLWAVDDRSTSELMRIFYRERQRGMTKAHALQRAQLTLLQHAPETGETASGASRTFAHPYYWAPFVLIGNWK